MKLVAASSYATKVCLKLVVFFLPLCLLLLSTKNSFSQADTGVITGTVTDPSGAILPGVKVTITAIETNRRQTFVTDNSGRYSSGPLRVGDYRIEAELTSFKRLVRPSISLQVQETAVLNLQMELGAVTQQTTVTAAEDLVRTADAS